MSIVGIDRGDYFTPRRGVEVSQSYRVIMVTLEEHICYKVHVTHAFTLC